jgi:hypothetical protein
MSRVFATRFYACETRNSSVTRRNANSIKRRSSSSGVDVSREGFEMDDKKIMDIVQWQAPTTVRGVREFIGFVNFYRRWIPGFSDIAKPLHDLV